MIRSKPNTMTSIRTKLIVYIGVPTLLVYVAILGGTLAFLRARSFAELDQSMTRLASDYAGRFDGYLREAAAVADTAAVAFARNQRGSIEDIYAQLRANVTGRPFIYGACAAFEPETGQAPEELFAPYVYRQGASLVEMNITRDVYDWYGDPQWTWFREPKTKGTPVWSAPYFDKGAGNVLMTTYSAPFFVDSTFAGVATVDIDLAHLQETIGATLTDGAEFAILACDGSFVYDRRPERILKQKLVDVARAAGNRGLEEIVPALLSGRGGVAVVPGWNDSETQRLFYSPIASTDWVFMAFTPERIVLAGVRSRMVTASAGLATTLAIIVACITLMSGKITRPLFRLTAKVREIAAGNIDARVTDVTSRDELGQLASAFNTMAGRLREHIDRLAEQEAARQKIEHDLSIARGIQRGLLPTNIPPLPGFDLAGWSQPADETGGDYYDWQPLPNGRLAITLADVTGHGIGPALVTAVCRAYARASFSGEDDLGRVMDRINQLLCEDLQSERFVTFVVALVDPGAHAIRLLSAGHGPLFFYEAAADRVHLFDAHDIPMGVSPGINHGPPSELRTGPGDVLVLITDGFFEWADSTGDQYGSLRLAEAIRASHELSAVRMIESLVVDVLRFAGGTRQLDDLTAVVLKRVD
jgi:sigma-B regulation protein RsbU (phosphoserine phosphatase)